MSGFWYCKGAERELGPFSLRQLQALVEAGKLFPDTPLREKGSEQWITAAHLDELYPSLGEPVGAAATPVAAERTATTKSGAMKVVPRAKPLVAPESPQPPPTAPAPPAPVAVAPARVVPRGQVVQVAAGPPPIPAMMPAPVVREVKPIVSVTPPGGAAQGSAVGVPRASGGNSGMDDMLSIAAVGLGLVGLATFAVPYAPIALGILSACAGAACFFLSQKSERALGLSMGGLVLGLAAAGVGAFQMNAAATKPPEVVKKPDAPVAPSAGPVDPAAEEEARDAKILEEAKQREEQAKKKLPAETPVGTQKTEPKVAAKAPPKPAIAAADPRRQLINDMEKWHKPIGFRIPGKSISIKVTSAWLTSEPNGSRPAAVAAPPVLRTGNGPPKPVEPKGEGDGEGEERLAIPGLDAPSAPPREQINRPAAIDAPLAAPSSEEMPEASGKYLCVEVQVSISTEGKAFSIGGWSDAAKNVLLLDDRGTPLAAVPAGASKGKGATIAPGGAHSQVFTFECPTPAPEVVRLALAGSVVGWPRPIGFEIKREMFTGRKTSTPAAAPPVARSETPMPAGIPPAEADPAPEKKPDEPPPPAADPDAEERIAIPGLEAGKKDPIRRAPEIK